MGSFFSCCRRNSTDEPRRGRRYQRSNAELQEMQEATGTCSGQNSNNRTPRLQPRHQPYQHQAQFPADPERMEHMTMATANISSKGKPLIRGNHKWTSETPITRGELEKQRREFWETSPEFGGKKEIWSALKGAIDVWEREIELAGTILDCAGVVLPTGELTEVYDELGFRYNLPDYILSDPTNLQEGQSSLFRRASRNSLNLKSMSFSDDAVSAVGRQLRVRMNSGADLVLDVKPSLKTIEDLGRTTIKAGDLKLDAGQKIMFFYSGKGPLDPKTKLDELGKLDGKTPIQAWIS